MFEKETINFYQKLKEEELKNPGAWTYSPVETWKIDYFLDNLNENNLKNFRRTSLSAGLISFPDRPLKYKSGLLNPWIKGLPLWQKIRGIRDIGVELLRMRKKIDFKFSDIKDNLVGNPCYYKLGRTNITDFAIRMCFYSKYLKKEFSNIGNVLEIGGGFGGLCQELLSSPELNIKKYVLVDLPESLALTYYYLMNSQCKKDRFIILPPWELAKTDNSFDLLVNTMSFQHMSKENINYYFSEIERLNIKNLFLVNRDTVRDPSDVKISDYPIPSKYRLVKQDNYPFSRHLIKIYSSFK